VATLYLISTPIGNLDDLTIRASATLHSVSHVLAEDTRRTRILLDHIGARPPLTSLHAHNEAQRTPLVLSWMAAGEDVALVSDAGTPLVSDPGARLVAAVLAAGHDVTPVPGPSAVLAALVASGLPGQRFTFFGFLPRRGGERRALLERIAVTPERVVLYESPERLVRLLNELTDVCGPERHTAVARELTKVHEEFFRGTLADAADYYRERPPRGEVTVVVAPAERSTEGEAVVEAEARALARRLRAEGMAPSRAARALAERLALSRNRAYRIVHEVECDEGGGSASTPEG